MAKLDTLLALMEDAAKDPLAPKNVKSTLEDAMKELKDKKGDVNVKLSSITYSIEKLTEDVNIEMHIRVKLFNILSAIETVKK